MSAKPQVWIWAPFTLPPAAERELREHFVGCELILKGRLSVSENVTLKTETNLKRGRGIVYRESMPKVVHELILKRPVDVVACASIGSMSQFLSACRSHLVDPPLALHMEEVSRDQFNPECDLIFGTHEQQRVMRFYGFARWGPVPLKTKERIQPSMLVRNILWLCRGKKRMAKEEEALSKLFTDCIQFHDDAVKEASSVEAAKTLIEKHNAERVVVDASETASIECLNKAGATVLVRYPIGRTFELKEVTGFEQEELRIKPLAEIAKAPPKPKPEVTGPPSPDELIDTDAIRREWKKQSPANLGWRQKQRKGLVVFGPERWERPIYDILARMIGMTVSYVVVCADNEPLNVADCFVRAYESACRSWMLLDPTQPRTAARGAISEWRAAGLDDKELPWWLCTERLVTTNPRQDPRCHMQDHLGRWVTILGAQAFYTMDLKPGVEDDDGLPLANADVSRVLLVAANEQRASYLRDHADGLRTSPPNERVRPDRYGCFPLDAAVELVHGIYSRHVEILVCTKRVFREAKSPTELLRQAEAQDIVIDHLSYPLAERCLDFDVRPLMPVNAPIPMCRGAHYRRMESFEPGFEEPEYERE